MISTRASRIGVLIRPTRPFTVFRDDHDLLCKAVTVVNEYCKCKQHETDDF